MPRISAAILALGGIQYFSADAVQSRTGETIRSVSERLGETGKSVREVSESASRLTGRFASLNDEVDTFLDRIRAA